MHTSLQAVHIIEPVNLSLAKNLTQDQDNQALTNAGAVGAAKIGPRTWNDAVFVEVHISCETRLHCGSRCPPFYQSKGNAIGMQ